MAYLDEHFAGTTVLELFVQLPAGASLFDKEVLTNIQAFTKTVSEIPDVGRVISIADAIALAQAEGLGPMPASVCC